MSVGVDRSVQVAPTGDAHDSRSPPVLIGRTAMTGCSRSVRRQLECPVLTGLMPALGSIQRLGLPSTLASGRTRTSARGRVAGEGAHVESADQILSLIFEK